MNKDMKEIVRQLRKQGWDVSPTRNGHFRARSPNGSVYTLPHSPSDRRSVKNARSDLRRLGAEL
jgi:predicted RNA binding protein YcfA (HicA-like mRNA interferase family)